jgi:hypothetical protein
VLIQKESHLLELCRYVVLNPVRARRMRVKRPQDWPWSSYRAAAGLETPPPFLNKSWVRSQFAPALNQAQLRYREFVRKGVGLRSPMDEARGGVVLGTESFADAVLVRLSDRPQSREVPRSQRLSVRPSLERLLPPDICDDARARDQASAEAHLTHGYTQAAIADHLGLHYATVCRIIQKEEAKRTETHDARSRVAPAGCPAEALSRSGLGDFHHPAPPLARLTEHCPR